LGALQARPVWLPQAGASTLQAEAASAGTVASQAEGLVDMCALPSLEHILVEAGGRQQVVLRANGAVLQLTITGADVTAGPVHLSLRVEGLKIREACDDFAALARILAPSSGLARLPRWTATTRKLRNALIALDGRAAGASYRDLAVLIYGRAYVEGNWYTGLKERMRRDLQRGLVLSGGGYRDFLRWGMSISRGGHLRHSPFPWK
jgi:hypothetical protein